MRITRNDKNLLLRALNIAITDLRSNYGNLGIYASPFKHRQYWARDSFIASIGACTLNDYNQVKNNLNTFIKYQRNDGHIPARIEENYHFLTVFGIYSKRKKLTVLHKQSQPWASDVVDSNSWFIISSYNYIKTSNNQKWFRENVDALDKAIEWLISKLDKSNLIKEGFTANWSDCNFVKGNTIYNNVLAWKALLCISELSEGVKKENYLKMADFLKVNINKYFWDDVNGYFIHYIGLHGTRYKEFYSDGNLLSIWWGLANQNQTKKIYKFIDNNNLTKNLIPIAYPRLVLWDNIANHLIFPMYKTENTFTLWTCIYILSKIVSGNLADGAREITRFAETIVNFNTCHEVLTPDGKPVDMWFYKSEKSMAWTSGMFILAFNQLTKFDKGST